MNGWEFNDWSVTLNGRRFAKSQVSQTWLEQDGYAMVQGRKIHYWLYNTVSYHNGNADDIYNRYIPKWVEDMKYVIDYDNIEKYDPNPNLATSVQALMQQRGCDVSVALIRDQPGYDYIVINEWFKSRGVYKTVVYPLFNQARSSRFEHWRFPSNEGVVDLGIISKTTVSQIMNKEFADLFKTYGSLYAYGDYLELNQETINGIAAFIKRPQDGHLYKVWYQASTYIFASTYPGYINDFFGYIWFGSDNSVLYKIYEAAN
jgi:hypothetical protein